MPGRFPFVIQKKYPHLSPEDREVWETFIAKKPDYYDSVDYDTRVGEGRQYPQALAGPYLFDMIHLSKLRIDVVGFRSGEIHIIELKPIVNHTALGQVINYTHLYNKTYSGPDKIIPVIIATVAHPDVRRTAESMGIKVFLV